MGGNAALPHVEDFLQFGDRKFLLRQQKQDAQPAGIAQQPERFEY